MEQTLENTLIVSLGDIMVDVYFRLPDGRNPRTDTEGRVELAGGGSAANFAVWIARQGRKSALIGRVGDDFVGHALVMDLEAEGVEPHIAFDPQLTTGRVGVLTAPDGERDMVCDRRANTHLRPEDVGPELVRRAAWVHISGYAFFEPAPRRAARKCMELACDAGVPVSVDPAAYFFIRRTGADDFMELCSGATVVLPNLDEGRAMTGLDDPFQVASSLLDHFPVVALKLGADGCLGMSRACRDAVADGVAVPEPLATPGGPIVLRLPAIPTEAVDTTGAGDAFNAGFVAAYSSGADFEESLACANRLGAAVVGQVGARPRASNARKPTS